MAVFSLSSKYNYSDLNRVENKIVELHTLVKAYNPSLPNITSKTNWVNTDFPYLSEIDRIKNNIILLNTYLQITSDRFKHLETLKRFFDFIEANKLEYNLELIEKALNEIILRYCGTSYLGDTIWL